MKDGAIAELHTFECGCCCGWYCPWCGHLNFACNTVDIAAWRHGLDYCGECANQTEVAP